MCFGVSIHIHRWLTNYQHRRRPLIYGNVNKNKEFENVKWYLRYIITICVALNIFSSLFTIFSQTIQTSLVSHRDRSVARVEEQRILLRRIASEQRALAITVEQAVQSIRECTPGIYKP